jgi:RHS repeat-associated protein
MKSIYLYLTDRSVRLFIILGLVGGMLGVPLSTPRAIAGSDSELSNLQAPTLATETSNPSETPSLVSSPPPASETPTIENPTGEATATLTPTLETTDTPTASPTEIETSLTETVTLTATPTPTVSTEEAETMEIDPVDGGKLISQKGWFEIEFPGGAVEAETQITFTHLPPSVITSTTWVPSQQFELTAKESESHQPLTHFQKPATIKLSLDQLGYQPGHVDGRQLWFGYYDEALQDWVSIPFTLDQTGTENKIFVEAETDHFTTFGLGGKADPGWALKFDEPVVALASGAATFSYPFQIPAGRGGVQPQLALGYSSRNVDHLKGWYQSDWVGQGWSLGTVEITRRLGTNTTQTDADCTNYFTLVFNGTGYQLIAGTNNRWYTREDSQLYIQYMPSGGNNQTGTYWIVRDGSGTTYRLGYVASTEQRVRCTDGQYRASRWRVEKVSDVYGNQMRFDYVEESRQNCTGSSGPTDSDRASYLATIWYNNLDRPTDPNVYPSTWGTKVVFNLANRPSATDTDDGYKACDKLFFQSKYLSNLTVSAWNGSAYQLVRSYQLSYTLYVDSGRQGGIGYMGGVTKGPGSRVINSITETGYDAAGNGQTLPATTFSYLPATNADPDCVPSVNCGPGPGPNTDGTDDGWNAQTWDCRWHAYPPITDPYYAWTHYWEYNVTSPYGTGYTGDPYNCMSFIYWRLGTVANGYGAYTTFVYGNDNRGGFWYDGYNYRVTRRLVQTDNQGPAVYDYSYGAPCYDTWDGGYIQGSGGVLCDLPDPAENNGTLLAHSWVQVTQRDYGGAILGITKHTFAATQSNVKIVGRETLTEAKDALGNLLKSQTQNYTWTDLTNPTNRWAVNLQSTLETDYTGGNTQSRQTNYFYDSFGNLERQEEYSDAGTTLYRRTVTPYVWNDSTSVWIVNRAAQQYVEQWVNSAWSRVSETRNIYDGLTPQDWHVGQSLSLTQGRLMVSRQCATLVSNSCTTWVDTKSDYDSTWLSNLTKVTTYNDYGSNSALAGANPSIVTTTYESTLNLYPLTVSNSLGDTTTTNYDLRTGLVTSQVDPNGATTSYTYDKFGRQLTVNQPGETGTPTIQYEYRDPSFPWIQAVNSQFESSTGWAIGWFQIQDSWLTYSTSQAHSGSQSLKMAYSGSWPDWVGQKYIPGWQSGKTYKISAWVRGSGSPSDSFYMALADSVGEHNTGSLTVGSTWQLVTLTVTPNLSGTSNAIILFRGSGTVYVDDLYIQAEPLEIGAYFKENVGSSTTVWARQVYDGMGRAVQDQSEINDAIASVVDRQYDARGLLVQQTAPYSATSSATGHFFVNQTWTNPQTVTRYDALGRASTVIHPDSTVVRTTYRGLQTDMLDASGRYQMAKADAFGRQIQAGEPQVTFTDAFGSLNASNWTFSCQGATPGCQSLDSGAIKNAGTGSNFNANFYRPAFNLNPSMQDRWIQVEFKVDDADSGAHFMLEDSASSNNRVGVIAGANKIYVQYRTNGGSWVYPSDLINPVEVGVWYVLTLKASASGLTDIEVWRKDNPSQRGAYRVPMPAGLSYRFHHWVYRGNAWLENYQEFDYQITSYAYAVTDQLVGITDTLTNTTVITYNVLGQKIGMLDPDMGAWSYAYDLDGNLTQQTDAQGQRTCLFYDVLNRLKGKTYQTSGNCPATDPGSYTITYNYDSISGGNKGRGRRTGMTDSSGSASWVYDVRGRVLTETKTITGAGTFATTYAYDPLDRVTAITYPTGEVVTQTYNAQGLLESLRSQTNNQWYVTNLDYNANGSLAKLQLGNGTRTLYGYNGLIGNPWDSRPGLGLTSYGRLWESRTEKTATGEVLQAWRYGYDNVGNVTTLSDMARTITGTLTYAFTDTFNTKDTVAWTYNASQTVPFNDGGNNVVKNTGDGSTWNASFYRTPYSLVTGQGAQLRFKVDNAQSQFVIALVANMTDGTYRRFGIYGHDGYVNMQYKDSGVGNANYRQPTTLIPALQANTWYALKLVVDDVRGMTVEVYPESTPTQRATYNIGIVTGVSWRFQAWTLSNSLYLDEYKEFTAGAVFAPDERQTFSYDALDRLLSANPVFTEGYTATYIYNPIGNVLTKTESGPTLNYAYNDAAHKHAVTHLNGVQDYWYDANGNMTKRIEGGTTYTQTFNAENQLITVTTTSGTTTFVYDGDGNRVKKVENGVTTIYVGALFEKNLTTNVATSYYLANGKPIALRQNTTVSYLHGDHLGSTSLTTDASGNVVARQKYLPYGQVHSTTGTLPTDKGFTSQRLDATGLMYYGARYYSTTLGRFISADTLVPGAGNPQTLNRFAYSLSNPLKYTDPSGHLPVPLIIAAVVMAFALTADAQAPASPLDVAHASVASVVASSPSGGAALVNLFTSDAIPGNTPQTRFDTIVAGTRDSSGTQFRVKFPEGGIQSQYDDVGLPGGGGNVGHFIQGAAMAYKSSAATDDFNLTLITGHEMIGDMGGPSGVVRVGNNIAQLAAGATHPDARNLFLEGTDTSLSKIFAMGNSTSNRTGNSLQDLRLSYQSWIFGKMLRNGQFATNGGVGSWLEEHITDVN